MKEERMDKSEAAAKSAARVFQSMFAQEINPSMVLYEELAGAFVGFGTRGNSGEPMACYDYDKCLEVLGKENGWPKEDCIEFLEYNYISAWRGDGTPFFLKKAY